MPSPGGSVLPADAVEWTLVNSRRKENRTYQQVELSIEGEARLLSLAREAGRILTEAQVDWPRIGRMIDTGEWEWDYLLEMLGLVQEKAPHLIAESTLTFLGIFPTDENGQPNPKYNDERAFIHGAVNFTRWVDMIQTFIAQNDYRRLAVPFGKALNLWNQQPAPAAQTESSQAPSTPSSEPDTATAIPAGSPATTPSAS